MAKTRVDDELCIDLLIFVYSFVPSSVAKINDALLRKIEIQFCFICCGDLDHL